MTDASLPIARVLALLCPHCGGPVPLPSGTPQEHDELDDLNVTGVHQLAVDEIGMVETCGGPIALAPNTVKRLIDGKEVLTMTLFMAQQRTPWLRERIRRHRAALAEKRAIDDARRDEARDAKKNGRG